MTKLSIKRKQMFLYLYFPYVGVPEGRGEEEELVLVNVLSWLRTELIRVPWYKDEISRRMWIEGVGKAMQNMSNESGGGTLVPVVVGPMGYQLLRGLSAVKAPVLIGNNLFFLPVVLCSCRFLTITPLHKQSEVRY